MLENQKLTDKNKHLFVGHILAKPVFINGQLFLAAGKTLTEENLERFITSGIKEVSISMSPEKIEQIQAEEKLNRGPDQTIPPEFVHQIEENLKNAFSDISGFTQAVIDDAKELTFKIQTSKKEYGIRSYKNVETEDSLYKSLKIFDESERIAEYAIVMANKYNENLEDDKYLSSEDKTKRKINSSHIASAALFAQIGTKMEDPIFFAQNKEKLNIAKNSAMRSLPELSEIQFEKYDKNLVPFYSYALLLEYPDIESIVKTTILLSGANENGFPHTKENNDNKRKTMRFVKGKQPMCVASRILKMSSIYVEMLQHICKGNNYNFNRADEIFKGAIINNVINL